MRDVYLLLEVIADIYDDMKPKSLSKAIRQGIEVFDKGIKNPLAIRNPKKVTSEKIRKWAE